MATVKKPTPDELKAGLFTIAQNLSGKQLGGKAPTISLPAQYGPSDDEYELQNQPDPTPDDLYGAPEGWDWRTATTDWDGDPLPKGAISFDKYGYPYYGSGFKGVWNKIKSMWAAPVEDTGESWWKVKVLPGSSDIASYNTAMYRYAQEHPEKIPEEYKYLTEDEYASALEKSKDRGISGISETWENVKAGEGGGVLSALAKGVETVGQGVFGIFNEPAKGAKKTFSAAAEVNKLDRISRGNQMGIFTDYINSLTPEQLGTDKPRDTWIEPTEEEIDEAWKRGWHAGNILYSSAFDYGLRDEYIKAMTAGDVDPDLLAMEFENPIAEMVGEIIFDPLNLPIGRAITASRRIGNAYDIFVKPIDGWTDAFRALENATTDAEKLDRMKDVVKITSGAVKKSATGLDNYANSHKFFGLTADGKRYVVSRSAGEIYAWMAKNMDPDKPDEAIEMFRALAKIGSGDETKIAEAMRTLTNYRGAVRAGSTAGKNMTLAPLVSKAGREAGIILNKLMDADFLDDLAVAQKGGVDGVAQFIDKRMGAIVDEMFPTIDDLVKRRSDAMAQIDKGKTVILPKSKQATKEGFEAIVDGKQVIVPPKVEDWLLAVNKLNNAAQKVVSPFNKFFAYVYMGLSPGYAFRNFAQDILVGVVDNGVRTITKTPSQIIQNGVDWLGGVTPRGVAGFGGPASAFIQKQVETSGAKLTDALKRMDARVAAGIFEEWASMRVVGTAVEDAMLRMLKPGKAIPDYGELIAAGMPDEMADFLTQSIIKNKGDVKKAAAEARKALKLGSIDNYRNVKLSTAEASELAHLGIHDDVLTAVGEAPNPDALNTRFDEIVQQAREFSAKTSDEITPHLPEDDTVKNLAIAIDELPDATAKGIALSYHDANKNAVDAYKGVLLDLRSIAPDDPDIKALEPILNDISKNAIETRINERALKAKRVSDKAFLKNANLEEIWTKELHMTTPAPKTPAELKDRAWREYYFEVARATNEKGRDDLVAAVEAIAARYGKQDSEAMLRARELLRQSREWDLVQRDDEVRILLRDAINKGDGAGIARIIANQYGIPSATAGGVPMDQRVLNTINKYSEQKFDSLSDIKDPQVVRDAFAARIADNQFKATQATEAVAETAAPAAKTGDIPKTVFHATTRKFEGLPDNVAGFGGEKRRFMFEPDGIYFNTNKDEAIRGAGLVDAKDKTRIVEAQPNVKNAYVVTSENADDYQNLYRQAARDIGWNEADLSLDDWLANNYGSDAKVSERFTELLKEKGYDSVYNTNNGDFIVFDKSSLSPAAKTSTELPSFKDWRLERDDKILHGEVLDKANQAGFTVVRSYDDLPPIEEGFTRLYHGTYANNLDSIKKRGLLPQSVTKPEFGDSATPVVIFSREQQIPRKGRFFGEATVIVDVPNTRLESLGKMTGDVDLPDVPPENIKAVYVPHARDVDYTNTDIGVKLEDMMAYSDKERAEYEALKTAAAKPISAAKTAKKAPKTKDLSSFDPKTQKILGPRKELEKEPYGKMISDAMAREARAMLDEYGGTGRTSVGLEDRPEIWKTISYNPEWYKEIYWEGSNKEAVFSALRRIIDDEGKDIIKPREETILRIKQIIMGRLATVNEGVPGNIPYQLWRGEVDEAAYSVGLYLREGLDPTKDAPEIDEKTIDMLMGRWSEIEDEAVEYYGDVFRRSDPGADEDYIRRQSVDKYMGDLYRERAAKVDKTAEEIASLDVEPELVDPIAPKVSKPKKPYASGTTPTWARMTDENLQGVEQLLKRVSDDFAAGFGDTIPVESNPALEKALRKWELDAEERISEARLIAANVGNAARDFTVLSYPQKTYADLALAYLYPYHFWYSRSYAHWLQRLVTQPGAIAAYSKYRTMLEKIHAGAPDWYKYQINSNELLGIDSDNPLFFNLEATLNPLNGLVGVDFTDARKRKDFYTNTLDDLNKFGPSTWTPFSWAAAIMMKQKGEDDAAARWAGRLAPITSTAKAGLSALGINLNVGGGINEFDPMVHLFSGGIDPYERDRVGRALGWMVEEGEIDAAAAIDAGYAQAGPVWQEALRRAIHARSGGQLSSFFLGVGFKARSVSDMQIDKFYNEYMRLWNMGDTLHPDEFRRLMDGLRIKYPFMDTVLLAKKAGPDRDTALAYNVIGRIPPGSKTAISEAAGIDRRLFDNFYETKGDMTGWAETDKQKFMAAVVDIGAALDVPPNATRQEWTEASIAYNKIAEAGKLQFGDEIVAMEDAYYSFGEDIDGKRDYIDANPILGDYLDFKSDQIMANPLLKSYYAGIERIERYYNSFMYARIEKELGDVWALQDEYNKIKYVEADRKKFLRDNPNLVKYWEMKADQVKLVADMVANTGKMFKPGIPALLRQQGDTTSMGVQDITTAVQQPVIPEYFNNTWDDWMQNFPPEMQRLLSDYVDGGKELPRAVESELEYTANNMGIDPELLLELIEQSQR